jgi:hypothetical protein
MRHLGRALVLISAGLWTIHALPATLMALGMFLWGWLDSAPTFREVMANVDMRWWRFASSLVLQQGLYLFTPWISAVIAWCWQAVGGGLLVLEGLFVLLKWFGPVIPLMLRDRRLGMDQYQSFMILVMLIAGLLALAAGSLFLASWWRSRRSGTSQDSA